MIKRAEFHVRGEPLDGEPLHYTASGLDYVYLLNGFTVEEDPDYGRIVTIKVEDDLLLAIGLYVICQERRLTGAEFRFLRKQMKITQKQLAKRLGVEDQTVANYEKGKVKIPFPSEQLLRMVFLLWVTPPDERASTLKELAEDIQRRKPPAPSSCSYPPMVKTWHGAQGNHEQDASRHHL